MPQYERTPPLDPLGQFALWLLNKVPGYETAEQYLSGEPDPSAMVNPLGPLVNPLIGTIRPGFKALKGPVQKDLLQKGVSAFKSVGAGKGVEDLLLKPKTLSVERLLEIQQQAKQLPKGDAWVSQAKENLRKGKHTEVLIGFDDRGKPYIRDGNSRIAAAKELKLNTLPVEIKLEDYPDLAPSAPPAKLIDTAAIKQKLQNSSDNVMDEMLDIMLGVEGLHKFYEQEEQPVVAEEAPTQ